MCLGASARYTQLVREKQRKMEQLEKCMGASKGLKIAGVSTIGLTAVGVAANIAEAKTIKTNEKAIEKKNKEIESAQKALGDKKAEIAKKEAEAEILAECKTALNDNNITSAEKDESGNCKILTCDTGFEPAENKQSCEQKENIKVEDSQTENNFKILCESEELGGTFNMNSIPKEQTSGEGKVIKINIPVKAACVLSGDNNTNEKCLKLAEKCENPRAYHYNSETGVCACLGDAEAKCLNGEAVCYDEDNKKQDTNSVKINREISAKLDSCKRDVQFATGQKWTFGKAIESGFRDMASKYTLAVQDDTEIYQKHKTTIYQEIFEELKSEIDNFTIPEEPGQRWSCNSIAITSDGCAGKKFRECSLPYYECKLNSEKMKAERRAKEKYTTAMIEQVCYNTSL